MTNVIKNILKCNGIIKLILYGFHNKESEWMNEYLMTPQKKNKKISYWVSEKGKCNEMLIKLQSIKNTV